MQRWKPTKAYWNNINQLYGNVSSQDEPPKPKKRKPRIKPVMICATEAEEQIRAATWLDKNHILFYHVPNGGNRSLWEGVKFKRMGVKSGVPDICIPLARKGHHGLYIELKRATGGVLSDSQRLWGAALRREGYDFYEAKGADDLILYVKSYLELS